MTAVFVVIPIYVHRVGTGQRVSNPRTFCMNAGLQCLGSYSFGLVWTSHYEVLTKESCLMCICFRRELGLYLFRRFGLNLSMGYLEVGTVILHFPSPGRPRAARLMTSRAVSIHVQWHPGPEGQRFTSSTSASQRKAFLGRTFYSLIFSEQLFWGQKENKPVSLTWRKLTFHRISE